ncbi:MAG: RNA-directed DNA polymerase [Gammaproteobacteria bacterium]|nr:MAG: RNA-directed DNA polymerase [Gammaproteobacteria bacterium]
MGFKYRQKVVHGHPTSNFTPSYKVARIPKSSSKYRKIYIPDDATKQFLRSHIPTLEAKLSTLDSSNVNYAFVKGKNAVLNALQHIGFNYTLSLDLVDFFDSVSAEHIEGVLSDEIIRDCFVEGAPRQGLPTSPLIASLAFMRVDDQIIAALQKFGIEFSYTRYADDLTFSFNERRDAGKIKFVAQQIIQSNGFALNHTKTRLQCVNNGRVIITGVAVDREGLYPTRKTKKKLRAASHQGNLAAARGLGEWAKCKLPKELVKSDG